MICFLFTGCRFGLDKKSKIPRPKKKEPYYKTDKNQPINWEADELWEDKLKPLSETDIPSDFSSNKDYVLKLASYLQAMSPEGLNLDESRNVYTMVELDVKHYAKVLLGLDPFDYEESNLYNKDTKCFEFTDFPDNGFVYRSYKNRKLEKLPNNRWRFSVDVAPIPLEEDFDDSENTNEQNKQVEENTQEDLPGVREIYVIEGKDDTYKLISVERQAIQEENKESAGT
jgi:hypothetical protein